MATRITATEAARNFSDILNRVRYRGESFIIERSGDIVAELSPRSTAATRPHTGAELIELLKDLPEVDPGFAEDVREAIRSQEVAIPRDPWES
ncbi:MAG: hypothetical protein H7144_16035 [Burkholderiales bacterium]|nr:hypothetical protein [Phycisphaerae bacterium]